MSQILTTILIAFALVILAIALMGIGWLITGKSKLRGGMCGRLPSKKSDGDTGCDTQTGCGICGKTDDKTK